MNHGPENKGGVTRTLAKQPCTVGVKWPGDEWYRKSKSRGQYFPETESG